MRLILFVLLLLLPITAVAQTASAETEVFVVRNADRPAVLPKHYLRVDLEFGASHLPDDLLWHTALGAGFGVTDRLEVGAQFLPLLLTPDVAYGQPSLYAAYHIAGDAWTWVPGLQIALPVADTQSVAVDVWLNFSGVIGDLLILTLIPNVTLEFTDPADLTLTLPVEALFQITRRAAVGLQSGAQLARGTDALDQLTVPLAALAVYTAGSDGGPLVDIGLAFTLDSLIQTGRADTFDTTEWTFALSVTPNFAL